MNKTETSAAVVKPAYVRPRIVCYAAASESSLCTESPHLGPGGGHKDGEYDGSLDEEP